MVGGGGRGGSKPCLDGHCSGVGGVVQSPVTAQVWEGWFKALSRRSLLRCGRGGSKPGHCSGVGGVVQSPV